MRKIITIVIVMIWGIGLGQEIKIPNLVMPSPQAFEFTKFGNLPIDESTGRVNPTIPIYNYEVGKLQVPISLSYSGNGVKVEQKPTWTGINWILNVGGIITRIVKDVPDENGKPRVFYSHSELKNMEVNGVPPLNLMNQLTLQNDFVDSEGDIFNFSFPGYSGEFVLIKNTLGVFEAKLLKYQEELKIEILGSFSLSGDYEFKITTTDGTSYFFGGMVNDVGATEYGYATEETQFSSIVYGGHRNYGTRAKTAFYLTKIENYLGDRIFLEYYTKDEYKSFFSGNKALYQLAGTIPEPPQCGMAPPPSDGPNDLNILSITTFNGKFLKRIWNQQTSQTVNFESSPYSGRDTNGGGSSAFRGRILTGINFTRGRVDLEYLPTKNYLLSHPNMIEDKFYLENITFKNSNNNITNEVYKLKYNDASAIPSVSSKAQDYLGYYNGKIDNISLLPKNSTTLLSNEIGFVPNTNALPNPRDFTFWNYMLGDRTPSFYHASKGVLTKITYPTGGSSVFEYEPISRKIEYNYTARFFNIYINNPVGVPISKPTTFADISYDPFQGPNGESNLPDNDIVYINQTVNVNLDIKIHNRANVNARDVIYIKMTDPDTNEIEEKVWQFPNPVNDGFQTDFNASIPFNLAKNHKYHFQIGFRSNAGGALVYQNPFVEVNGGFQFISGISPLIEGAGIRIKKVVDFENNNSTPINIRRYYYQTLKSKILGQPEMGCQMYFPDFHGYTRAFKFCAGTGMVAQVPTPLWTLYLSLNTNSFDPNSFSNGALAMFSNVTISYGGDNFENGAVEKSFLIRTDRQAEILTTASASTSMYHEVNGVLAKDINTRTNESNFNGTLLEESVWEIKNNVLFKKKTSNSNYEFEETTILNNISGKLNGGYEGIIARIGPNLMGTVSDVYIGTYETKSHKIKKVTNTTKEFIDGVPIIKYTTPPFQLVQGWRFLDQNNNGIRDGIDPNFITPDMFALWTDEQIETPYKRIATMQETNYYNNMAGLVSSIKTSKSDNTMSEVKNFYPLPNCISQVNGLTSGDIYALNNLKSQNRISNPFQVETYNNSEKLTTQRTIYKTPGGSNNVYEHKIQTAKGNNSLEDRIVYHHYDLMGNPAELSLKDGTNIVYIWSYQRKPIYKIVNADYESVYIAMSSGGIIDPALYTPSNPQPEILINPFINSLPNAQVTIYNYDPITQLLKSVIDPKGDILNYNYDSFWRLQSVTDKNGNILSENEYHYKP